MVGSWRIQQLFRSYLSNCVSMSAYTCRVQMVHAYDGVLDYFTASSPTSEQTSQPSYGKSGRKRKKVRKKRQTTQLVEDSTPPPVATTTSSTSETTDTVIYRPVTGRGSHHSTSSQSTSRWVLIISGSAGSTKCDRLYRCFPFVIPLQLAKLKEFNGISIEH